MTTQAPASTEVELSIGGMTCASCAARIEKKLNRMGGVSASVNYATEKAKVTFEGEVEVADLIATVEATGYTAALPEPPATAGVPDAGRASPPTSWPRCASGCSPRWPWPSR